MSPPGSDRNLLLGVLALQLDFVGQGELIGAMHAWAADKAKPLGVILRDRGHLSVDRLRLLDALVDEHLKAHGGDPLRSLAALGPLPEPVRRDLESVADTPVRESLAPLDSTAADAGGPPLPAEPPRPRPRYRILRPHARGGLGEVYVAEDSELGRQVALKEIRAEHSGDPASRRRFVLEAEVTGGLEHPGVVPVYGLGCYADGRPFYAMRFVQGDTFQEALRQFHAGTSGRFGGLEFRQLLRRFVDVCNAVAYAHSRGVLHRDLKPSNVLLGRYGGTLVVDWGLAKPLGRSEDGGGEATLRPRTGTALTETVAGQVLGTPAYMAPEQAAGRLDDLGPAADVYSLGATLYEILTGKVAFEGKSAATVLEAVRAGRFPPPRAVQPGVPRALEAVCLKAMALRPGDRYGGALDLAAEVERWLADEAVSADREPLRERARRWVKRHRTLVTGAAAALLVGVVSLGVAAALLSAANERERYARGEAEQERDIARAQKRRTREALDAMTSQVTTDWLATQPQLLPQQREFLRHALTYYQEFAREAGTDEAGRQLVADAHQRIGQMLRHLGQHPEAEAAHRRSVELFERLAEDFPATPMYRKDLAANLNTLGLLLSDLGKSDDAEAAHRRSVELFERLAEDFPAEPEYRNNLALSLRQLGVVLKQQRQLRAAEAAHRRGIELLERLAADFPDVPEYRHQLAASFNNLGFLLYSSGRDAEEMAAFRRAVELWEPLAAEHPDVSEYRRGLAVSFHNLGGVLSRSGQGAASEAAYRRAIELRERLAADFPAVPLYREELASSHMDRGTLLQRLGRAAEVEAASRRAVEILERLVSDHPAVAVYRRKLALNLRNLGILLAPLGKGAEAEAVCRRSAELYERLTADFPAVPEYVIDLSQTYSTLALLDRIARNRERALDWYAQAIRALEAVLTRYPDLGAARTTLAGHHADRADVLAGLGRHADALGDLERAIALADTRQRAALRLSRARILVRAGQPLQAVAEADEVAGDSSPSGPTLYEAARVHAQASAALRADGSRSEHHAVRAVALLRQAVARGFADFARMLRDRDLDPLHRRADFTELLWDLADGPVVKPSNRL